MKRILLITALAVSLGANAQQGNPHLCLTDHLNAELIKNNPEAAANVKANEAILANYKPSTATQKKATKYIIPVVFHVIHNYGPENISKEQIEDQIRVLNEDFSRTNADAIKTRAQFLPDAADAEIEFRLATKDPSGNCTDGIVRVASTQTVEARDNVKSLSRWPNQKYLNIWVVTSIRDTDGDPNTTTLGYAYLPGSVSVGSSWDGVVVVASRVGTIGTSNKGNGGRTLTHEVGHYLGLPHPFGTCTNTNCATQGDGFCDTPPVLEPSFGCNLNKVSCGVTTQIENYMDYANGSCANMFTNDQRDEMHKWLDAHPARSEMVSINNLIATGTNDGAVASLCAPKADFSSLYQSACSNTEVYFSDASWGGDVTSWQWTFEGGTPATSIEEEPTVVYENPGIYKVTLKVTNASGSDEVTKNAYIEIKPGVAAFKGHLFEGFESETFATDGEPWVMSVDDKTFDRVTNTSLSGDACLKASNNATVVEGTKFTFITPTIDLSAYENKNPKLSFYYAYSKRTDVNVDILRIFISVDCGRTWVQRHYRTGTLLATVDDNIPFFTPSSSADWELVTIGLSNYDSETNLAVKFEFEGNRGNNIYIDDINLSNFTSSINTVSKDVLNFNIYPNPSNGSVNANYYLESAQNVTLAVYDVFGKQVQMVADNKQQPAGTYEYTVNGDAKLAAGIYYVKLTVGGTQVTQKLIVLGDN